IEEHRLLYARKTPRKMTINWLKSVPDSQVPNLIAKRTLASVKRSSGGPLRVWVNLINGRPDQTKSYNLGIDISKGMGASNSVISIACNETREKIAEWAHAGTPPYEFARIATAIGVWVGGKNKLPLIIWENNGHPGWDFGRQLVKIYQYPNIWYDRAVGTIAEKISKKYGWHSSQTKKPVVLGMLRRAYAHGGYINHSTEALDEALTYIEYEGGGIGPAEYVEESDAARKCHGDRVIADMLNVVGFGDTPRGKSKMPAAPHRSFGHRMAAWKRGKRKQTKMTRFDHSGVNI
ncbi:hypothetical protein LCGC14_2900200, partial [marine sediment metagenome]